MASSKPASTSTPYLAYILRMWVTDRGDAARWQASLEDPDTGRRIGFANLEELFIFLMEQSESSQSNPSPDAFESLLCSA